MSQKRSDILQAARAQMECEHPVEYETLQAARRMAQTCSICSTMVARGTMSEKSYVESVLQAETKFINAVAAIRQKEGNHG